MNNNNRYVRHFAVDGFDEKAQQRLSAAKVLVIGCGALGSMAAMYLAGAGVGHLTIADFDFVDISNLHRQLFYKTNEIGTEKCLLLSKLITDLNPEVSVTAINRRITESDAASFASDADIILDCTDNAESKYLMEQAAIVAGTPIIIAGVSDFHGQVTAVRPGSVRFSEIFPPSDNNTDHKGIIGPTAGTAASLMTVEAIKIITRLGKPLFDRLLTFDLLTQTFRTIDL